MGGLREDLFYSLKSLLKAPRFTAVVIMMLSLGIGANSAIFSVVNAVLLRPLPFPDAARVVNLAWQGRDHLQQLSSVKFQYWHDHARSFDAMATWQSLAVGVDIAGDVSTMRALHVSRNFLEVLGHTAMVGGEGEVLITQAMWRSHFGSAPEAVGRIIRLNDEAFTIAGVLPESFEFPYESEPTDMLLPLRFTVDAGDVAENWPAIASLREGVTHEQAEAEIASLNALFRVTHPSQVSEHDRGMRIATFNELYVDGNVQRALWILMFAVTLVLLIACANTANLFLARSAQRRSEFALRAALGASHGRITRMVLIESVLLALAAGALGLLAGRWFQHILVALAPVEVRRMETAGLDWRVVLFTFAVSLATSLLFGGITAWPAARARLSEALKESARGSSGRNRFRQGLLAAQAALSMVLLAGAGLMAMTLIGLMRVDAGFDPERLVAVRIPSKPAGYATSRELWEFQQRVAQHFEGSSIVASIAGASSLPLERGINTPMTIAGKPNAWGTVEWRAVTPDYFRTLGAPLRVGRGFENNDGPGNSPVAIVNETFARTYFPNESAIGQRVELGRSPGRLSDPSLATSGVEIVGIVADIREISLRTEPRRTVYVPQAQASSFLSNLRGTMPVFVARVRPGAGNIESAIVQALRAADPAIPRPQVFPVGDIVARSLARERFGAAILSALAALAVALTSFGIYSVLAYTVHQRRREIGIRMALGAPGSHVMRLIMVDGIGPVLIGVVLGAAGALGLSRAATSFLWGVTPTDPATLVTSATILVGMTVLASWIPAREAAETDPVKTLNS